MTAALSVLDLAPISAGDTAAGALRKTVDLAQHAERWGYRRYWVAEHHYAAVASASPAVLIGQLAAATTTIRVGAAAVQLGHTTAIAVVESFATLDAFHPGRIDLGVGRSGQRRVEAIRQAPRPPRPPRARHEVDGVVVPAPFDLSVQLRNPRLKAMLGTLQQPEAVTPDFGDQVADILALLNGTYQVDGFAAHASPGAGTALRPWVFGTSRGQSARVAGSLGLPFVAAYHIVPATALEAVEAYRNAFRPSQVLAEPYVVVSADVLAADDSARAHRLARGFDHWVYSIRAGGGAIPYPDPDTVGPLTDEQLAVVADRLDTRFVGSADEVAERLAALARVTGADELVITSVAFDHADRLRSHELIATAWGS
ncbi:LLM class flavin-dependent oxidoreductase [Mycolicibacterium neoaurum]|uniref:LLM class flavin-dependent oxidoreductase n=1 Tax=Mycolicibacterium neoaurum TaxID=1795 RepID=UPI00248CF506|nr:LLM class flavin-dependent oxidoreductase [Mycolicibacterium neoaurum]WBP92601.1 LLM class flavin-dependent oxidoreductase [Mycolicibacterium neoaurum]WBS06582.1 LLM class flavin-dependent oxidoreductase [Mycolicibacterium neoaurum]